MDFPGATIAIDLLALGGSGPAIKEVAATIGYTLSAPPMSFAGGQVEIVRVSKVHEEEILSLDILILAPSVEAAVKIEWVWIGKGCRWRW